MSNLRFIKVFSETNEYGLETEINKWIQKHQVNMVDIKYNSFLGWEAGDGEIHTAVIVYQAEVPIED